jgi:hypothetical protein
MGNSLAGLVNGIAGQRGVITELKLQQSQTGGRSFESVVQQTAQRSAESAAAAAPAQDAAARPSAVRVELMEPQVLREIRQMIFNEESRPRGGGFSQLVSQAERLSSQSDAMLREMSTRKDLTQGELLMMQTVVYKAAQSTEVLSKVVDQVTGSIKTILNTNV